jgi:hypothetical protein
MWGFTPLQIGALTFSGFCISKPPHVRRSKSSNVDIFESFNFPPTAFQAFELPNCKYLDLWFTSQRRTELCCSQASRISAKIQHPSEAKDPMAG